CQHYYSIPYSC
nr:immunoglobulin light chain junction region [Macaca mulatta]